MRYRSAAAMLLILGLSACSSAPQTPSAPASPSANPTASAPPSANPTASASETLFPDVLDAKLSASAAQFTISVTISSPYDTPARYADGWRVLTEDGTVLATHTLAHDHASEQPFTRTSSPFSIPDGVTRVVVEGRDQISGYGGKKVTVEVPR